MTSLADASFQDLDVMLSLIDRLRAGGDDDQVDGWATMVEAEVRRRFERLAEGAAMLDAARAARARREQA